MPFPAMSGADPCTGSNIEGNTSSGFKFADGAIPIEPAGRPKIGQNVTEQIGPDDHIEPIGMAHKVGGKNVDVILVGTHIRKFRADGAKNVRPKTAWYK